MAQVFISYASLDKAVADRVCGALEAAGVSCWIAPRNIEPGTDFPAAIVEAVHSARVLVLVLTEHAAASPHILSEVGHAFNGKKQIIPFRLSPEALPEDLEYFLSMTQWLDAPNGCTDGNLKRLTEATLDALAGERSPCRVFPTGSPATEGCMSLQVGEAPVVTPQGVAPMPQNYAPLPPPRPSTGGNHRALYMALGAVLALSVIVVGATQLPRWLRTRAAGDVPSTTHTLPPETGGITSSAQPQQTAPGPGVPQPTTATSSTIPSPAQTAPSGIETEVANQTSGNTMLTPTDPLPKAGRKGLTSFGQAATVGSTRRERTSQAASSNLPARAIQAVDSATSGQIVPSPASDHAPASQAVSAAANQELEDRMTTLVSRATTAKESVENLRRQQQSQGLNLRGDIGATLSRMDQYMTRADTALASHDASAATRNMDLAEREIDKLEKVLGH